MSDRHLAQFNVARLRGDESDPRMKEFYASLDPVNAVGERMEGFVWRLKNPEAQTTRWPGDKMMITNLTVWENIESLEKFVWQTVHAKVYARKREWLEMPKGPALVMWWIEAGTLPTLDEAIERMEHLQTYGPSEFAFGWESVPAAKLWREKRCA